MSDFDLYYWPVPFRGQFIRAILAHAGKNWTEHDAGEIAALMEREPGDQPIGFMGPPLLVNTATGFAISQMPAIALYLGEELDLLPPGAEGRALTAKIVNDANDVIDELTLDGGRQMWTPDKWDEFVPRLQHWMRIFAATGQRHGFTADDGFLLGTPAPGIADIVTATLWSTMADRFGRIATLVEETVPAIQGLTRRMQATRALAALQERSLAEYGDEYCGGEIGQSLRQVAA
ncbi:glutathione S-transferase [Croceibacterium sp. TMG7-5b_MA50]|uniref:glutathione S-transferase n=1 Tax=Croceibacterium sp. TMG7-5b_MA50 TaxID=3121290 RepID=UPI00322177EE